MTAAVLPDAERLIVQWALGNTPITDALEDRIYTALPESPGWPCARLTRVGGAPVSSRPLWLDQAQIQVDVWGGPKATTHDIAQTFRAEMAAGLPGVHGLGVVTKVELGAFTWLPDATYNPAKPRYTFDAVVTLHP